MRPCGNNSENATDATNVLMDSNKNTYSNNRDKREVMAVKRAQVINCAYFDTIKIFMRKRTMAAERLHRSLWMSASHVHVYSSSYIFSGHYLYL